MSRLLPLTAASALALSGCGTRSGNDANAANAMPPTTENGQLTVRAQGVDLKIDLPAPIRRLTEDNAFLYPGARTVRGGGQGRHFRSGDPPVTVALWYRDPARAGRFSITSETREGEAIHLAGTARGGEHLDVRLAPGSDGGTDGQLVVTPGN